MASGITLIERAGGFASSTAVASSAGRWTYGELLDASTRVAATLLHGADDLNEARVCFLVPPGFEYVAVQWGIWRAGAVAVPLGTMHPPPELEYVLDDAEPCAVIADATLADRVTQIAAARRTRFLRTSDLLRTSDSLSHDVAQSLPTINADRRAMMLYTSGTTGRPKGVVTTHANIEAQITSLEQAWQWTRDDRILHVLPLHHIHGIVNVLSCTLWSGAACEFLVPFDAGAVWERFAQGDLTLFMAVPTIYAKLIAAWEAAPEQRQRAYSAGCSQMRLMVSGSSALPVRTLARWQEITGHVLLERYGMTEIGMALSNPLRGERVAGHVGIPLPGVEVRRVDQRGKPVPSDVPGEIEVRGLAVFREYWRRPEATERAFHDGWFRTGDVAVVDEGQYRILGRESVDIIKTGGYKVSALEIEEVLRLHEAIGDCAVVGVDDEEWGQRVAAALVIRHGQDLTLEELRPWAKERLAAYKVPTLLLSVESLPRNAMGKVSKTDVERLFSQRSDEGR